MALKLQEEYGDDIQVLFVEVQGATPEKAEGFALKKKWLGGRAMWTTERPFDVDLQGIPQFGLVSPTGELVLSGYSNRMHSEIKDTIAELVKEGRKAPSDMPKRVGKAWAEMAKGNFAKALDLAREAAAEAGDEAERKAAEDLVAAIEERVANRLAGLEWMMENGYLLEAQVQIDALDKALKGHEEAQQRIETCREKLDSEEMKNELAAAKALAKIEKKLYADGPEDKHVKNLMKLAEKHGGTKAAQRASHLAKIAQMG